MTRIQYAASLAFTGFLVAAPVIAARQYEAVTVTLPKGDPAEGRKAFLDLKCTTCHRVTGETGLPIPISDSRGPDLNRTLVFRPASELASAIIVPSHSMSLKTSPELKKRLSQTAVSPMGDFSRAMTVRQLADLLAYLGSLDRRR